MISGNSRREFRGRTVGLAQAFFAVASASLAIWSLVNGHVAARSLPAWIPWGEGWVYGCALTTLAASAGLFFWRTAWSSVLVIAVYQAASAGISAPRVLADPFSIGAWYPLCEALTALTGAWILGALLRARLRGSGGQMAGGRIVRGAQILFGLTCVFYGSSHFVYAQYTAGMVPAWMPSHLTVAYLTGLCHVTAGAAIVVGILPRLAATLEALMMSLFGALVWIPSFFAEPRPSWAGPPEHQWSELVVTLVLAASAWVVAASLARSSGMRAAR